jgi:hypothetical protein
LFTSTRALAIALREQTAAAAQQYFFFPWRQPDPKFGENSRKYAPPDLPGEVDTVSTMSTSREKAVHVGMPKPERALQTPLQFRSSNHA